MGGEEGGTHNRQEGCVQFRKVKLLGVGGEGGARYRGPGGCGHRILHQPEKWIQFGANIFVYL